jgi:putative DNA primase/helicase
MTPSEKVLSRFPDARKSGTGWSARCPAHEDRSPSLSISEGNDGRVLVHCHAGCSAEAVCTKAGLSLRDLMPERPVVRGSPPAKGFATADAAVRSMEHRLGPAAAQWAYLDDRGQHVGSVVRWNNLDGTKREVRPLSLVSGEWRTCGLTVPRPLYRLPELREADVVYVVEGEKAADAAKGLGLTATTSPHGSQSASKADWTILAGKQVVILPDNDAAGWQYAADVHDILTSLEPPAVIRVVELPGLPEDGGDIADLDATDPVGLFRLIEEAVAATPPGWTPPRDQSLAPKPREPRSLFDEESSAPPQSERPVIWLEAGQKPRVTDQSLAALAKDFFQRGGQLVRVLPSPVGARIIAATEQGIDDTLNRRLEFRKFKTGRDGKQVDLLVDAPAWLSKNICQLQAWHGIRDLDGVHRGPLIRRDGSVAGLKPGYDAASRCWIETDEDWSPLETPATWEQVREAIDMLLSLVDEFPFSSDAGKSVWLATILTRLARSAFDGPSPLFVYNATTPASGKGILAKLVGIIADGMSPGMVTLSRDEEELKKLLTSALREDAGILVLDNATGETGSPTLDRFLTSTLWTDRVLGKSQIVTLPNLAVPIITANNATIRSDTGRRAVSLMLTPNVECPELRQFRIPDICSHALRERRSLLIAAIRILQWHFQNGLPEATEFRHQDASGNDVMAPVRPFGSYEGWCRVVRQAVINAGMPDPVMTNDDLKVVDEKRWARRMFLQAWRDWNPAWEGSAREMLAEVFPASGHCPEEAVALREAITTLVGDSRKPGPPTPTDLGNQIREFQGTPFANLRVEYVRHSNTGTRWRLSQVVSQ